MPPPAPSTPIDEPDTENPADYFVDMIDQLADEARRLGETEVALHLEATAQARRTRLAASRPIEPRYPSR